MTEALPLTLSAARPDGLVGDVVRIRAAQSVLHRNADGTWYVGELARLADIDQFRSPITSPEDLLAALADLCAHSDKFSGSCLIVTMYFHDQDPILIPRDQWPTFTAVAD